MNTETKAKHTPGPWTLEDHPDKPCELFARGAIHLADIYMTDFPEPQANARLIAAAPELLEVVENLLNIWPSIDFVRYKPDMPYHPSVGEIVISAENAIRKAKGEL